MVFCLKTEIFLLRIEGLGLGKKNLEEGRLCRKRGCEFAR